MVLTTDGDNFFHNKNKTDRKPQIEENKKSPFVKLDAN